jgi:hypothetical protein
MYRGPSSTYYLAAVDGGQKYTHKHKLCSQCAVPFQELLDAKFEEVRYDIKPPADPTFECFVCKENAQDGGVAFFVTAYAFRDERSDFWAIAHRACWGAGWETVRHPPLEVAKTAS